MEIYQKLERIQKQLKAPKNQHNKFGGYNYRSCEDILEAVKPLLDGCVVTISDTIREVGGRIYVEAEATISDGVNQVNVTAYAREPEDRKGMDASQITGSASSYARKYALNGLFLIDDTKDADATNTHDPKPASRTHTELVNLVSMATSQAQLKQIWSTLSKAERESVKNVVAQLGEQLKLKEQQDTVENQDA